jgi:hypothetical protein
MISRPNKRLSRPGKITPSLTTLDGQETNQTHVRGIAKAHPVTGTRLRWDLLAATIAALVVAAPMIFTKSGFALDFTNHLWLTWVAGRALVESGHPSYFLSTSLTGAFYPWFAFYGGTLYMIVGGLSELIGGHPIVAFVGFTTLAIAATYLGMVWLAREFGLGGWTSHAPALTVVTSAYYITNLYGRGAWTEFIATAVIAPLLASTVHLVRVQRWRAWPVLAFVVSAVLFTGSHNITTLWGSTVAVFAGIVMWIALGAPRHLPIRRLAMVGGLGLASVLVNAWFLLPDISYARDIRAHLNAFAEAGAPFLDTPQLLLYPLRKVPVQSGTPALYDQAPVWSLVWGLLAGGLLIWSRRTVRGLRGVWVGVVVVVVVVLGMIIASPVWNYMPFPFDEIQYPYRLSSYVFYAVGGLVLLGALALREATVDEGASRRVRGLRVGLAGVCAVSLGLCVWQLWIPNTLLPGYSYTDRQEALASVNATPRTWYDPKTYNDVEAPVVEVSPERVLAIEPGQVHGDRFSETVPVPPGMEPIQTNIAAGSYLAHISGLVRVGRNTNGYTVVRRERPGDGPVQVVVQTTSSTTMVLGWTLSIVACLAILAILVRLGLQGFRLSRPALRVR